MIPWLRADTPFPPVERALRRPNGLLAAGGDLSPQRLLDAYRHGIFPWYGEGEPILWWSPDPRMVLFIDELHISKSLRRRLSSRKFEIRINTAFRQVIERCAEPRPGQNGTWITPEMVEAYCTLHELGYAHSVETWLDGELAGGIYGVQIGRMFFGESMFTRVTDASKVALVHLVWQLMRMGVPLMDCQQETPHTASMGARPIPRSEFKRWLQKLVDAQPSAPFSAE
jgi:leucyl/phenylalanyl-tRNA--protein transferase